MLLVFLFFMGFFFFFFGCGILVPQAGIEPAPPALEGEVSTTEPPGKSPRWTVCVHVRLLSPSMAEYFPALRVTYATKRSFLSPSLLKTGRSPGRVPKITVLTCRNYQLPVTVMFPCFLQSSVDFQHFQSRSPPCPCGYCRSEQVSQSSEAARLWLDLCRQEPCVPQRKLSGPTDRACVRKKSSAYIFSLRASSSLALVPSSASPVNTHITSPGRVGISSPRGCPLDLNPKSNLDLLVISGLAAQLGPTLREPTGCSSPDSSVHGILQADILEWVATPFPRGPSWPRDQTWVSWNVRQIVYHLRQASDTTSSSSSTELPSQYQPYSLVFAFCKKTRRNSCLSVFSSQGWEPLSSPVGSHFIHLRCCERAEPLGELSLPIPGGPALWALLRRLSLRSTAFLVGENGAHDFSFPSGSQQP